MPLAEVQQQLVVDVVAAALGLVVIAGGEIVEAEAGEAGAADPVEARIRTRRRNGSR